MSVPQELSSTLQEWLGPDWRAEPLTGDASVRAYYRVHGAAEPLMIAFYPEAVRADLPRFLAAYEALQPHVSLPAVLRHTECSIVQTDVGDETLYGLVQTDRERGLRLYRSAIDLLVAFQNAAPRARGLNPPFDRAKFGEELEMAAVWYVEKWAGADAEGVRPLFDGIVERLLSHPYVLCHRDYHGQNLHVVNDTLFVIDYQDLRMGPDTYDLASLLRDRGIAEWLGRDEEEAMIAYYAGLREEEPEALRRRYFETLLQRSIKILGTFARQALERQREHYLRYIPPTLKSIELCLQELPEFSALRAVFSGTDQRRATAGPV